MITATRLGFALTVSLLFSSCRGGIADVASDESLQGGCRQPSASLFQGWSASPSPTSSEVGRHVFEIDPAHGSEPGGARKGDPGDDGVFPPYPNEPDGFTPLTERDFRLFDEDGWSSSNSGGLFIVMDEGAPIAPPTVIHAAYPAGFPGGSSPGWSEIGAIEERGVRGLYASFWVKVSENWQGHPSRVNKIGFFWIDDGPAVFTSIQGRGAGTLHPVIHVQGLPGGSWVLEGNLARGEVVRGEWHQWEVLLISNQDGGFDGEIHWWLDGNEIGDHRGVRFGRRGAGEVWQRASWRPIWGGCGAFVDEDMYMRLDRFYISGSPGRP